MEGQDHLLQLTAQCTEYFQRFTQEKDSQTSVVRRVFSEITFKVREAFGRVIEEADSKRQQICEFLVKEEARLLEEKASQEDCLEKMLSEVQNTHLSRLEVGERGKETLTDYAGTLDRFLNAMMEIEKTCYEDSVEECVHFLNNLVKQELQTLIDSGFPRSAASLIDLSQPQCFTFNSSGQPEESTDSLFPHRAPANSPRPVLSQVKLDQEKRSARINQYQGQLSLVEASKNSF